VKALLRRICQLEERVASSNSSGPSWVDVLMERQRRRREASGLAPEEPLEPLFDERGRPTSNVGCCVECLPSSSLRGIATRARGGTRGGVGAGC
jgi:hypothetical protein